MFSFCLRYSMCASLYLCSWHEDILILTVNCPYDFVFRIAMYIYIYNGLKSLCCIKWRAISFFSVSCNILFPFFLLYCGFTPIKKIFLKLEHCFFDTNDHQQVLDNFQVLREVYTISFLFFTQSDA